MMATTLEIARALMQECGKTSPDVQRRFEAAIGDIVLELLGQNEGRFTSLRRRQDITLEIGKAEYKLNGDYNTAISPFIRVDIDGKFVRETDIVVDYEFYYRLAESGHYPATSFARVEKLEAGPDGRGYYLILGAAATEEGYFRLFYYREPTLNDTDIVRKPEIIKHGVRGQFPEYWPDIALKEATIFERMKSGFRESISGRTTGMTTILPKKTRNHNKMMHDIGRGQ